MINNEFQDKLLKSANIINKKSLQGSANYIVVSERVAKEINKLNEEEEKRLLLLNRRKKINKLLKNEK